MRDYSAWRNRRGLARALREEWMPTTDQPDVGELLDTELGLYALQTVAPGERPEAVWTLLSGYPIAEAAGQPVGAAARRVIRIARELLPARRAPQDWIRLISRYRRAPEHVRGYLIAPDGSGFTQREPRVAPYRFEVYEQALAALPAYRTERVRIAGPGDYLVRSDRGETGVRIPEWLPTPEPCAAHDLALPPKRRCFTATREDLEATARWADRQEKRLGLSRLGLDRPSRWAERLADTTLLLRAPDGRLVPERTLKVQGTFNLGGMVGSGKSTLMDLLSIDAVRRDRRVTLVVGDVTTLLRKVNYFNALFAESHGPVAAPLVGHSNRQQHVERLHRLLTTGDTRLTALSSPLFDLVSTACPLDGLRDQVPGPWELRHAPCTRRLSPVSPRPGERPYTCPLWYACPRHAPARALVDAPIWVATIPSLVYSQVPEPINPEQPRYLEVAWQRSDLIVVDEADQAQAQLDTIFSPGQTLRSGDSEAWLDEIVDHTNTKHRQTGWRLMSDPLVRAWTSAANNAKTAADLIYSLLQIDRDRKPSALLGWIDEHYFTDWTLSQQLAQAWAGYGRPRGPTPKRGWDKDAFYQRLRAAFDAFIDDPLGEPGEPTTGSLATLTADVLREVDEVKRLNRVKDWLVGLAEVEFSFGQERRRVVIDNLDRQAARLEFTLALAVLSDQLQLLLSAWRAVEEPIGLEASNPLVFHRPPRDLLTVVPQVPMGHVLGFQYRRDEDHATAAMGELRFFRCEGVGRWALTHLADLFGDATTPPANVLLMSGTSWAGTSARYHLDLPVNGLLKPDSDDLAAIAKSRCELLLLDDESSRPRRITVSGRYGEDRARALAALVRGLARPRQDGKSLLERYRDQLEPGRRRVLLLTGSYEEARAVARTLVRARPGWDGQVRYLIRDDAEFDDAWDGPLPLRRGDVAGFSATGAWILVAPLLAIERGHNILNDDNVAALGAAFFLIRPHPRPDDLTYVAQRLNQWATTQIRQQLPSVPTEKRATLLDCGAAFRAAGYRRWRSLLRQKLAYSTLSPQEREALIWSQLVTIWQVIGRLVRGGKPASFFFCDAAFAPVTANQEEEGHDTAETSLAVGLRSVLEPYFNDGSVDPDRFLVQELYGPLYQALSQIGGM
jgi:hypothetical protein